MILKGDSLFLPLKDSSVDCCITSPPYWGLRKYEIPDLIWDGNSECEHEWGNKLADHHPGQVEQTKWKKADGAGHGQTSGSGQFCLKCSAWRGQLGLEPSFELYISHLLQIFDEVKRVLKPEGTCFVNLGDSYGGNQGRGKGKGNEYGQMVAHNQTTLSKSLCQIPYRFSIEMIDRGWILRNVIIWKKPNAMPSSVKDRFSVDFEPVFFFTKQRKYYFEQQFEDFKGERWGGDDYIIDGNEVKQIEGLGRNRSVRPNPKGRNKRSVWTIPTKPYSEAHFATFPPALIEPMIRAGCPEGGIVLDPFGGSGTTAMVAKKLNRIGISLDLGYEDLAKKRLNAGG